MRKGFTLVELSIVLVIIGLLIGGILAGQSMMETAKMDSMIKKLQQFDVATSNFQLSFQALPGDSNKLTPNGNNDGVIDGYADFGAYAGEIANFWPQLQQSGMLQYNKTLTATVSGSYFGCPEAGNYNTPVFFDGGSLTNCIVPNTQSGKSYWSISAMPLTFGTSFGTGFPVKYIRMLDIKIDDGAPRAGILRAYAGATTITGIQDPAGNAYWDTYCGGCNLDPVSTNMKGFRIDMFSQGGASR